MPMPQRTYSSGSYRYGFNGKENDNEVQGTGNQLDFGARVYDARLGRWFSPDKLTRDAPAMSPYAFADNSPIAAMDPDGNRTYFIGGAGYNPNPGKLGKWMQAKFAKNGTFADETEKAFRGILGSEFHMVQSSMGIKSMPMITNSYWSLVKGSQPILNLENEYALQATVNEIVNDYNGSKVAGEPNKPLNLMGSSYGSVMAAQATIEILEHPEKYGDISYVTSVTLSASPISTESDLYKKLVHLRDVDKKLGAIIYDPNEGDNVTGAAGTSPAEGRRNFFKLIFSKGSIVSQDHPHNQNAKDTKRTYNRMLQKTLVNENTEGDANKTKAQEVIKEKTGG